MQNFKYRNRKNLNVDANINGNNSTYYDFDKICELPSLENEFIVTQKFDKFIILTNNYHKDEYLYYLLKQNRIYCYNMYGFDTFPCE